MIERATLEALEREVQAALTRAHDSDLRVLGYGEISLVLGVPATTPAWACKRLPPFPDGASADRFEGLLDRYLVELAARGVDPVETRVERIPRPDGRVVVYCVQPVVPTETLGPAVVAADDDAAGLLGAVVESVFAVVDDHIGLDAQLSNWARVDGRLRYFDVTTPLLRAADGRSELDTDVFLASLPAALRPAVRRFVLPGIIARYHDPRSVVCDLAANLVKERLDGWIPTVLDAVGDRVAPPLTESEVRRDYTSDARMWALLQRVRRIDRGWQRHVRRRQYPFLLPDRIER